MKDLNKIQEFFSKPLEEENQPQFKIGDKVTYLGYPGEITGINKEMTGAITYNVSYDKGTGKTTAPNIYNKDGEIKPLNEESYKVAGRSVTLTKGKKSDGTDWKVKFQNGKEVPLADVLALIKPFPKGITKESLSITNPISAPIFRKDKNNPNFLNVYVKYYVPGGFTKALGQRTASGQELNKNSAEALKIANSIVKNLQSKFNLEDIDVEDKKNGTVAIFAVSDDFVNMQDKDFNMEEPVNENLNPEVSKAVNRFIKAMAKRYDYSEQDAVYAIMSALRQEGFQGLNEAIEEDPIDIVTMDVPLFIRVLEYAREDAQEDMDLHDLAQKAIAATKQQGILQMDDYDMLVGETIQENRQSLDDEAKIYWMQQLKSGKIDKLPEDPKAAFLTQMMKDQMDHDKETLRRERGLEEIASKVISKIKEERPGLWDNIRAKRERGEKPARKGSKAYKAAVKAGKKINKEK